MSFSTWICIPAVVQLPDKRWWRWVWWWCALLSESWWYRGRRGDLEQPGGRAHGLNESWPLKPRTEEKNHKLNLNLHFFSLLVTPVHRNLLEPKKEVQGVGHFLGEGLGSPMGRQFMWRKVEIRLACTATRLPPTPLVKRRQANIIKQTMNQTSTKTKRRWLV